MRHTFTVLRTELVSVPAGDFNTYVMKIVERGPFGGPFAETVLWYSPLVGLRVKSERRIRGGPPFVLELEKVTDPDGMQVYPIATAAAQPAVKLTAADGQKLFDTGDYAGAANAWFGAAQVGDALAMLKLGEMHEEGLGVTQSFLRAHLFYNLAAAKGSADARDARNLIAAKMTAETLDQAQELAEGWPESAKRLAK